MAKRLTKWEQAFWDVWQKDGLEGNDLRPHFNVRVRIDSLWADVDREFDFGSESQRLLIEIDGLGGFDPVAKRERCGAHQSAKGMRTDAEKRNGAIEAGWTVLHYPSSTLDSKIRLHNAVEQVSRVLCKIPGADHGNSDNEKREQEINSTKGRAKASQG